MPYYERTNDSGIREHKHNCFNFWHPIDRVHLGTKKPLPTGHVLSIPRLVERNDENIAEVIGIIVNTMPEKELKALVAGLFNIAYKGDELEFHKIVNKMKIESEKAGKKFSIGGKVL